MNFYIIVFDRSPENKYGPFHSAFVEHPKITRWWHYIKSSYIVGTELSVGEIADHFARCAEENGFSTTHLVVRVVLGDSQGRLIKDAWDWIQEHSKA